MTPGLAIFRLAFEISPVILTGNSAVTQFIGGNALPIVALTDALNFTTGLLSGANVGLNDFFCYWKPFYGSTLLDYDFGRYPFANQAVAANAVISQPLTISMIMTATVRPPQNNYYEKLATFLLLRASLDQHCTTGGTFAVVTPTFIYQNCLLRKMTDISASYAEGKQPQIMWQFDFEQPLLTLEEAGTVYNNLMSKLGGGTQVTAGDLSTLPAASASGFGVLGVP